MQIKIVGMAWYRPDNYLRLRAMFEDGDKLHRTYSEWLAAAEAGQERFEAQVIRVFRVDIDLNDFPKWCVTKGLNLNAASRMQCANVVAYRLATGGIGDGVH